MWYEILPSFGLVAVFLAVPPYASAAVNWLTLKGKLIGRRWHEHSVDYHMYLRDQRLTGSEYRPRGLEGLPDEK